MAHYSRGDEEAGSSVPPSGRRSGPRLPGPPAKLRSLSAVLPAFNEEGNIEQVLAGVLSALPQSTDDLEVIVVDDGSTDRTAEILDKTSRRDPRVVVKHHAQNRGYGAALQTGFRCATKDFVFYTDADGQFEPAAISRLIHLVPGARVISGYRERRQDPIHRRINAWLYNGVLRYALGLPVRDVNCAFKLYRTEDLNKLDIRSTGALVDAEILSKLHRAGLTIAQVGVPHYPRRWGTPSGNQLRVVAHAAWEFTVLWSELTRRPKSTEGRAP